MLQIAYSALFVTVPMAIFSLVLIPRQLRMRNLRARGVSVSAVCEERLYQGGVSVIRVNCVFSPADGQVIRARVNAPKAPPRVGQEFSVVFDPEKPQVAESFDHLHSRGRYGLMAFQATTVLIVLIAVGIVVSDFLV